MKERMIIVVVAVVAGLIITGVGFAIYQSTKKVSTPQSNIKAETSITPTNQNNKLFIKVTEPADETLVNKRTVTVKGTTNPDNIIVVTSNLEDVQGKPTSDGNFTVTVDIDAGANTLRTKAIAPNGDSVEDVRSITYSTEEF